MCIPNPALQQNRLPLIIPQPDDMWMVEQEHVTDTKWESVKTSLSPFSLHTAGPEHTRTRSCLSHSQQRFTTTLSSHAGWGFGFFFFLQNYLKMRGQSERLWDWKERHCDEKDQSCLRSLIRSNLYASKTNIPPHFSRKTPNSILIYTLSNLIDFRGIACGRNHQAVASQQ